MLRPNVEFDFLGIQKEISPKSIESEKRFVNTRSFRDIQSVVSKINPELLKAVIESGSASPKINIPVAKSSTPKIEHNPFPALPVYTPIFRGSSSFECKSSFETAPLTIFYKGTVAVFDLPRDKAESILKLAQEEGYKNLAVSPNNQCQLLETLNGDLPIARRKSLEKFLEKRKERLTMVSPYACSSWTP